MGLTTFKELDRPWSQHGQFQSDEMANKLEPPDLDPNQVWAQFVGLVD